MCIFWHYKTSSRISWFELFSAPDNFQSINHETFRDTGQHELSFEFDSQGYTNGFYWPQCQLELRFFRETRSWTQTFKPSIENSMNIFNQPVTSRFCRANTSLDWQIINLTSSYTPQRLRLDCIVDALDSHSSLVVFWTLSSTSKMCQSLSTAGSTGHENTFALPNRLINYMLGVLTSSFIRFACFIAYKLLASIVNRTHVLAVNSSPKTTSRCPDITRFYNYFPLGYGQTTEWTGWPWRFFIQI